MPMLEPPLRALRQMDDPVFAGVLWRSLAWSALAFVVLATGLVWGLERVAEGHGGWLGWLAGAAGGVGAALLTLFLFLPVATVIATLFTDRIAAAVEARYYPNLPPAQPASFSAQAWDGVALGLRVLAMQVVALVATLLLPGVGVILGWVVAAWAIGRGMYVTVAMRRMSRPLAQALYARNRPAVLAQGMLMAIAGLVPILNLLVPVLGTAAMVHLFQANQFQTRSVPAPETFPRPGL